MRPPGPLTSLPILGDLPLIGLGKAVGLGPPPHVRMTELANTYGDVMSLGLGDERWVVLSSPEAVHEAFVTRGMDFSGRPMVPSMKVSSGGGKGFAKPTLTPELKVLRQTARSKLFGAAQVARSQASLEHEAVLLAEDLISASSRDGSVELRPALRSAVTNMVLRYTFGASASEDAVMSELVEVVNEIWSLLTSTSTTALDLIARDSPGASALSSLAYGRLPTLVARRDEILSELIQQRRPNTDTEDAPMVDMLMASGLPSEDIHYTLVDMFVAGVNTVTTALEWTLLLTATEPLVQERARMDAHRHARHTARAAASGLAAAKVPPSTYVDAVLCEVLRFKSPLLLPRTCVRDSTIGGYDVSAGTTVLANNHALTSSPQWWRAPHLFMPERFLDEESSLGLAGGGGVDGCKFIPFSTGQRMCPGSRLAIAEMQTAARALLRTTRWRRADSPVDLSEEYSLTLLPAASQRLRFERVAPPTRRAPMGNKNSYGGAKCEK